MDIVENSSSALSYEPHSTPRCGIRAATGRLWRTTIPPSLCRPGRPRGTHSCLTKGFPAPRTTDSTAMRPPAKNTTRRPPIEGFGRRSMDLNTYQLKQAAQDPPIECPSRGLGHRFASDGNPSTSATRQPRGHPKPIFPIFNRKRGVCGASVPEFYTFSTAVDEFVDKGAVYPAN